MEQPTYRFTTGEPVATSPSGDLGLRLKSALSDELDRELRAVELSAIDEEPFSAEVPAYKALLNRRARIALLEMTAQGEGTALSLEMHPAHVVAAMEAQHGGWFRQVLARKLAETLGHPPGTTVFLKAEWIPPVVASPLENQRQPPQEEVSRLTRNMQRLGAILLLVPIIAFSVILLLVYNWAADIRKDYTDLQQTVEVQKQQILTAIEEGIEKSTDVMDIIDVVKSYTLGEDSTQNN